MTSSSERRVRAGCENTVPRSAEDFARCWKTSPERRQLLVAIQAYDQAHALKGPADKQFTLSRALEKSKKQRQKSPYNLSYWGQIRLCIWRDVKRLKNDPTVTIVMLIVNMIEALIIASLFSNLPATTASFFRRGGLLFMMVNRSSFPVSSLGSQSTTMASANILFRIVSDIAENVQQCNRNHDSVRKTSYRGKAHALRSLSSQRRSTVSYDGGPSVQDHQLSHCKYHVIISRPTSEETRVSYSFFLLTGFTVGLSMSMFFRLFSSMTKTITQALAPSAVFLIMLVLYTSFVIPVQYMRGQGCPTTTSEAPLTKADGSAGSDASTPVSYGLESLLTNEFRGRSFNCTHFAPSGPGYEGISKDQRACAVQGAVAGADTVDGTALVLTAYQYRYSNRWTNFAIILGIPVFLLMAHLVMSELVASERSRGEVLVFKRSKLNKEYRHRSTDEDNGNKEATACQGQDLCNDEDQGPVMEKQTSVFHWEQVNYQVQIRNETRTTLNSVDSWIKPGTLTALMVISPCQSYQTSTDKDARAFLALVKLHCWMF